MERDETDHPEREPGSDPPAEPPATWGPHLFHGALVAALVFFWWLLIYSHGVAPHGG